MLYKVLRLLLFRPVISAWWKPWVEGVDNIPKDGPVLLMSNHLNYGETLLIPAYAKRQLAIPVKAEFFTSKSPIVRFMAGFLRKVGMVPMDRGGGKAAANALDKLKDVLREDKAVAFFPEGTRSPDGRLYRARTGAARLALETGATIVPVGVSNTEFVRGPFGIPQLNRPVVKFGKPMNFSAVHDRSSDLSVVRQVTDEVMREIKQLTGQEYVDMYASTARLQKDPKSIEAKVVPYPGCEDPVNHTEAKPQTIPGAGSTAA